MLRIGETNQYEQDRECKTKSEAWGPKDYQNKITPPQRQKPREGSDINKL